MAVSEQTCCQFRPSAWAGFWNSTRSFSGEFRGSRLYPVRWEARSGLDGSVLSHGPPFVGPSLVRVTWKTLKEPGDIGSDGRCRVWP